MKLNVKWTYCKTVEEEHRQHKRQYAHSFHFPNTICTSKALWTLPKRHRDAILLHEVGHLLAGPDASEEDANRAIEKCSGLKIDYVDTRYGEDLETLN
jgi:hypothetical protein